MGTKKLTNTELAEQLGISSQAISLWKRRNEVPARACIDLEPIIKVRARKLYLNPSILFDMFNSNKTDDNKAMISE